MKRKHNCTFRLTNLCFIIFLFFVFFNIEIRINHYTRNIQNINREKVINSSLFMPNYALALKIEKGIDEVEKEEKINEEKSNDQEKNDENIISHPTQTEIIEEPILEEKKDKDEISEVINVIDTSYYPALSNEIVNISHYGHDCEGCTSGYTASGYYVGDGRIYYNDTTFGSVRVVAADRKYPIGTIVRFNYNNQKITAIVLDRGGAIGDGKKFQIDLLTANEKTAYELGIITETNLEVLRIGY